MEPYKMVNEVQEEIDVHKCMICHTVICGLESFISHGRTCTWENYDGTFTLENPPKLRPLGMPSPAVSYRSSPTASTSSDNGSDFDQINEDLRQYYSSLLSDDEEDCSTENDKMETSARSIDVGDEGDDDESSCAMEEKERIWKQGLKCHDYVVSYECSNALQLALKEACEGMKIDCPNLLKGVGYEENYAERKESNFPLRCNRILENSDASTTSCTVIDTDSENIKRKSEYAERECVVSQEDVFRQAVSKIVNGGAFGKEGLAVEQRCSSNTDGTMGGLLCSNPLRDLGYVEIIGDDEIKVPLVKTNSTLNIGHLGVDPEVASCVEAEINLGIGRGMKRGRGRSKRGRGRWRGGRGRGCRLDIQEKRFVEDGSSEYSENGAEVRREVENKVRRGHGRGRGRGMYRGRGCQLSKPLKYVENVIGYVVSNACKESGVKTCSDVGEKQVDSMFTALATSSKGRVIRKPVIFSPCVQKLKLPEEKKVCQTIPTNLDDINEYEATMSGKRRHTSFSGLNEISCKTTPGLETEQFHSEKAKRMRNLVAVKPVCDIDSNSGEVQEQVLVKPKSVNVENKSSVKNSSSCSKQSAKADTTSVAVEGTLDLIDYRDEFTSNFPRVQSTPCTGDGENQPTQSPTKSVSTENKSVRNSSSCSKQTLEADSGETQPTLEESHSETSNLISDDLTFAPKESSITEFNVCNMDTYTENNSPTRDLADTVVTQSVVAGMSIPTNESFSFEEDSTSQFVIKDIKTIALNTWDEISPVGGDSSCIIIEDSCVARGIWANPIDEGAKTVSNQISDQVHPTRLSTRVSVNLGFRCESKDFQQRQNAKLSSSCRNSSSSLESINKQPLKDNVSTPTSVDVEPDSKENNKLKFQGIFSLDIVKNLQYLKPLFSKLGNNIDLAPSNNGGLVPSVVVLSEKRDEKEKSQMVRVDYKKIDRNPMCQCMCGRKEEIVPQLYLQRQCVLNECQDPSVVDHTWECYLNPKYPNECICDSNKSITKANVNSDSRSVSECSSTTSLGTAVEMSDLSNIDKCSENPKINGSKTINNDPLILPRRSLRRSKSIDRLTYLRELPVKKTNKPGRKKLTKRRSKHDDGYVCEYTPGDIDSETEDPTYLSQRSRKTKRKHYRKKTSTKKLSTHNNGYVTDYNSCYEDSMNECDFLLERAMSISRCELFEKENDKGDNVSDRILRGKKNKFPVYREMPLRRCKSNANINYCLDNSLCLHLM